MRKRLAQSGFAAVAAVFLVLILAALGAFMVTFSNTQQLTSTQDLQGTRAYWAAQSGLEWGVGAVTAVVTPSTITASTCTTVTPLTVNGFSVAVSCNGIANTYTEAGTPVYIIQIQSTASLTGSTPGSLSFIQRSLTAYVER